jgi:hypothetical protein
MTENARAPFCWSAIGRTLRFTAEALAARYRIVRWLLPYIHVTAPEVEVRTETDWAHPDSYVVAAPAGAVALMKAFDEHGINVVDVFLEPVIAFGVERYPEKTIQIRNSRDRTVIHGWHAIDAEPVTESETFADDIVAVAYVLPDGSALCRNTRYASLAELLDEKRKAILTAK